MAWTKVPPSDVPGFYWVRWLDGPPVVSHVRPRYEDEPDSELWVAYHEEPVSRSGEKGWQFWPERIEPPREG